MATHLELARRSIEELVLHVFEHRSRCLLPITYGELTERIGHLNSQGKAVSIAMGDILSIVGHQLQDIGDAWGRRVPRLTALVVAKAGGLPSEGMSEFWPAYSQLTRAEKERKAQVEWDRISNFGSRWNDVLRALGLSEVSADAPSDRQFSAGGESPEHKALKEYVSRHPECVGVSAGAHCEVEYALPSGDEIDVFFRSADEWVAVEVKAAISDLRTRECERGLYQTIKYGAVLAAMARTEARAAPTRIRSVLVLQSRLPRDYHAVRDALEIQVLENVGR